YAYDNMWRPSTISYPDGGQTNYYYYLPSVFGGGPAMAVESQIDSTAGNTTTDYLLADGFNRTSRTAKRNGTPGEPAGQWDQEDTCYNSLGQASFIPYRYQSSVGFTAGTKRCDPSSYSGDSIIYDALGRTTSVTHSDSTSLLTTYTGRAVQVQDEGNGSGTR